MNYSINGTRQVEKANLVDRYKAEISNLKSELNLRMRAERAYKVAIEAELDRLNKYFTHAMSKKEELETEVSNLKDDIECLKKSKS